MNANSPAPNPLSAASEEAEADGLPMAWLLGLFLGWAAIVALGLIQSRLALQAIGAPFAWRTHLPPRVLDLVVGGVYLPVLLWLVRRRSRGGALAQAGILLLATAVFVGLRGALSVPLERAFLGPNVVFHGSRVGKGIGELLAYGLLAGGTWALELRRRLLARETQAAQLQARLSQARMDALASQLRPHFLFNTLNAISVLMHRDPAAADRMLTGLSELLRASLRAPSSHEIPLGEEVALLDRYVEIMRARYGPRLVVSRDVPPALAEARVPSFVLQPLVENALEHGVARRAGAGRVEVAAEADGGTLRLTVTDDGPGLAPARATDGSEGVGLGNTRLRLEQLYGTEGRLSLEPAPGGGTRAVVEIPLRGAPR